MMPETKEWVNVALEHDLSSVIHQNRSCGLRVIASQTDRTTVSLINKCSKESKTQYLKKKRKKIEAKKHNIKSRIYSTRMIGGGTYTHEQCLH